MVAVIAVGIIARRHLDPVALALGWSVSICHPGAGGRRAEEDRDRLDQLADEQLRLTYRRNTIP